MRSFWRFLAVFSMIILLNGCQTNVDFPSQSSLETPPESSIQPSEESQGADTYDDAVSRPAGTEYIQYYNGIKYYSEKIYDRLQGDNEIGYIWIEGLKDTQVQQNINSRIKTAAMDLYDREMPPYRGIKKAVAGIEGEPLIRTVYTDVFFNEANLLSVTVTRRIYAQRGGFDTDEHIALTFDLKTGEELTLADLFSDGYDYQQMIVEYVREGIAENWIYDRYSTFTLLKPFEAIKENQKFFISSPDTIYLLMDYETPEFDVEMKTVRIPIEAEKLPEGGAEFVFTEKYETWDDSIYQASDRQFRRWRGLKPDREVEHNVWSVTDPLMKEDEYYAGSNVSFETVVVSNIENSALAAEITGIAEHADERLAQFFQADQIMKERTIGAFYYFRTSKYGKYLNAREGFSSWGDEHHNYLDGRVYNVLTGRQMSLAECFVRGADYKGLLSELIKREYDYLSELELELELTAYFDNPRFELRSDGMCLLTRDYLYEGDWYISYSDIGDENLCLFD